MEGGRGWRRGLHLRGCIDWTAMVVDRTAVMVVVGVVLWAALRLLLVCAARVARPRSSHCACALRMRRRGAWALATLPPVPTDRMPPPLSTRARAPRSRCVVHRCVGGNARGVCHVRAAAVDPARQQCHVAMRPNPRGRDARGTRCTRACAMVRARGVYAMRGQQVPRACVAHSVCRARCFDAVRE